MTTAQRITILEARLNAAPTSGRCRPLRETAAIVAELRALGWGRAA